MSRNVGLGNDRSDTGCQAPGGWRWAPLLMTGVAMATRGAPNTRMHKHTCTYTCTHACLVCARAPLHDIHMVWGPCAQGPGVVKGTVIR